MLREESKPGRMAAHEKLNAAFVAAASRTPSESVSDNAVYAMNPKISRPSPEFAKYDVAFWTPKPADTRTAAAKPGATKQPASVKTEVPKQ